MKDITIEEAVYLIKAAIKTPQSMGIQPNSDEIDSAYVISNLKARRGIHNAFEQLKESLDIRTDDELEIRSYYNTIINDGSFCTITELEFVELAKELLNDNQKLGLKEFQDMPTSIDFDKIHMIRIAQDSGQKTFEPFIHHGDSL